MATIRLARPDDAAALRAIYAPFVETTATSFEWAVPSEAEFGQRITRTLPKYPWLVFDVDGTVAGYAYATSHRQRTAYDWSVESSVYLAPTFHRRGIGQALYTSLLALLTLQGFRNVYAGITLPNPASEAFHQAFGFEPIGLYRDIGYKFGAWHSVAWFQLSLPNARTGEISPPRSLADVLRQPAGQEALQAGLSKLKFINP
ncbi:phosphinothricin acetyltransferase [Catalinimonas alkaloidigena]|uniref:Phosphinothricin acetyltransferase n=1 Tax=Catalinimonas alkaloidigena TaxID=1075417 RepID=A0A1G9T5V8_9BACT|nr:arsinothricin resistance N-acetyltransferase ArsN1 family B [Catalinimonas alkaloidigena]SDM43071.1 phosphinothricin acetyltransferase [Catalinimonas alkaloidigena]